MRQRETSSRPGPTRKMLLVGCVAWMVGVAGWYTITAVHSVRHPPLPGFDWVWGWLWIGVVVAVGVSHWTRRRVDVTRLWLSGFACIACIMLILSRQLLTALVCSWLLVVAWAWGTWLLSRLHADGMSSDPEDIAIAVALGFGVLALLTLGLALIGGLYSTVAWAVLLGLTLPHLRSIYAGLTGLGHRILNAWRSPGRGEALEGVEQGVLVVLAGWVFLGNLAWSLTPEIQFDALNYHLAVPKIYIQQHRLVDLPYFFHSYFAHLVDMLFTLSLLLYGQHVAKLLMLAVGVLVAGAIFNVGRAYFSRRVGVWAAVLFYTTPLVSWLSSTTYIDLALALFLFTALMSLIRWELNRNRSWLVISGLLAGEALGAKLTAVFGLLPLTMVLVWRLLANQEASPLARLKYFGPVILSGGLMALPWFAVTWALTGNPVFPFFNGFFQSPDWPATNTTLDADNYGIGTSLVSLMRLPFSLTYDTGRFGLGVPAGTLGASLLMGLPMGIVWMRKRPIGTRMLLLWGVGYMLLWALVVQYARYLIPLLPVMTLLAASAVRVFPSPGPWLRRAAYVSLGMLVVAQGLLISPQFWHLPERFPIRLVLGLETLDAFLTRALPAYEAVQYLNRVTDHSTDKVIGIGASEGIRYYLEPPLESLTESPYMRFVIWLAPGRQLATALARHGSTFLLDIRRHVPPTEFLNPPYRNPRFLDTYTTVAFEGRDVSVYRLLPLEPIQNVLDNASFEAIDPGGIPVGWFASGRPVVDQSGAQARTGVVGVQVGPTALLYQHVLVEPGGAYTLGHWTRADRPGQLTRLQINWLDKHLQLVDVSSAVVSAGPLWAWHQMAAKAPDQAAIAQVYACVHTDGEVWFDDLWFAAGESEPGRP